MEPMSKGELALTIAIIIEAVLLAVHHLKRYKDSARPELQEPDWMLYVKAFEARMEEKHPGYIKRLHKPRDK